jgi:phosphate transport system ATP-binding protein
MVTQSAPDGSVLEPATAQRPILVTAAAPEVDLAPKVFEIDDVSVYYVAFRAVRQVSLDVRRHEIARSSARPDAERPPSRCLNRMNDLIPGLGSRGSVRYRGKTSAADVSPSEVRRHRDGVQAEPLPKSVYDNVAFGPH